MKRSASSGGSTPAGLGGSGVAGTAGHTAIGTRPSSVSGCRPASRSALLGRDPELPPVPAEAVDACWQQLVRRAQTTGGPWVLAVAGMLLPCLRAKHARLTRCFDPWRDAWEAAEIETAMLTGLYEHLLRVDATCGRLPARLCWAAYRAGRKVRDADATWARTHTAFTDSHIPAAPYGHPDLILDHAVTGRLLTAAEAELIGRTRLEQTTLAEVAAELGASYEAVKRRRARAEHKLLTALGDGTLSRYGYWPHPTPTGGTGTARTPAPGPATPAAPVPPMRAA